MVQIHQASNSGQSHAAIHHTWQKRIMVLAPKDFEEDLTALSVIVGIDVVVNIFLIAGANKDYSGRRKDLR